VGMARVWRDGGIASGCPSARPYPSPATVWGCWWSSRDLKLKQRDKGKGWWTGGVGRDWLTWQQLLVKGGTASRPSWILRSTQDFGCVIPFGWNWMFLL
jgi:hypothetical protein